MGGTGFNTVDLIGTMLAGIQRAANAWRVVCPPQSPAEILK